ncbi:cold shock domain-containing protein [Polaromonas sp.]|uniref:cold shock domain-containing protein n=1 Tax=Polaromonas sp. TaxID=1869339 RepID=UPI002488B17A|nr:cold shock domain-containing protein [Polaromonas sp.]MDI1340778.1 cold shock domain-containing protein [Polaromonas sp.]
MRFEGTLKSWNDDKGFGFISPSQGGQDIFVHISEYRRGGRPVLDEALTFEVALNPQGKKRGMNVQGVGAQQAAYQPDRSRRPVRVSRSGNATGGGLKTVVGLLLVAALGWQAYAYYQKVAPAHRVGEAASPASQPLLDLAPSRAATPSFVCDGRQHCSQMTSCAEATYFLKNCPGTKMDGDHDGVPCEDQLCR